MQDHIANLNAGDHCALKYLYDRFFGAGVMVLHNYIDDKEAISEIIQEIFIGIWDRRKVFESESHFKSYYYKSLRNRAINYLSRFRGVSPLSSELTDCSDSIVDLILKEEVRRAVSEALGRLPDQRKRVVELYMEGKTQEEMSDLLGVSVNTIKTHKRLAYAELRKDLGWMLVSLIFGV